MEFLRYGNEEKEYLAKRDPVMKGLIEKHGHVEREVNPDPFSAIVGSIISQQISTKAAETVEGRLLEKAGGLSARKLDELSIQDIQQCGLSFRKAGYIKGIAEAQMSGAVDFDSLKKLPDEEIIRSLVGLKGVGRWTAEMMLIFSFARRDVLSFDDLGIRRGLQRAYGMEELKKDQHSYFRELFSPYGTVASLYLWEEASNK
jgi:3-methyladenine DNA glycosylase/8-oxoguanine DNA glycosylase